jgi:hypothetical protein
VKFSGKKIRSRVIMILLGLRDVIKAKAEFRLNIFQLLFPALARLLLADLLA